MYAHVLQHFLLFPYLLLHNQLLPCYCCMILWWNIFMNDIIFKRVSGSEYVFFVCLFVCFFFFFCKNNCTDSVSSIQRHMLPQHYEPTLDTLEMISFMQLQLNSTSQVLKQKKKNKKKKTWQDESESNMYKIRGKLDTFSKHIQHFLHDYRDTQSFSLAHSVT